MHWRPVGPDPSVSPVCVTDWLCLCAPHSFSYYELYLSVSQLARNFRIRLHPSQQSKCLLTSISASTSRFQPVQLPARREWVAAVPTQQLLVVLDERESRNAGEAKE